MLFTCKQGFSFFLNIIFSYILAFIKIWNMNIEMCESDLYKVLLQMVALDLRESLSCVIFLRWACGWWGVAEHWFWRKGIMEGESPRIQLVSADGGLQVT